MKILTNLEICKDKPCITARKRHSLAAGATQGNIAYQQIVMGVNRQYKLDQ